MPELKSTEIQEVPFVDLYKQHQAIRERVLTGFQEILDKGDFILGRAVKRFEERFAAYCGTEHAVGVASGTDALLLALKAAGVGAGDEVITAANTFVATVEAIAHCGARPVLVDVDPDTLNIAPSEIERHISGRTKVILPVHLYGQPADMDPILQIARNAKLTVIEDAAQAHGARYKGRRAGSFGHAATFSFYPAKNLGACGDGGCVVTNDETMAATVRQLRDHGSSTKYKHELIGYNSRLDTLQAAALLVKLDYLDQWNHARRQNAGIYHRLLKEVDGIRTLGCLNTAEHVFHLYVVRVERGQREELQQSLRERGIYTGIHYPYPVHRTEAFSGLETAGCPNAEAAATEVLSLPMFPELTEKKIAYVVQCLSEFTAAVPG